MKTTIIFAVTLLLVLTSAAAFRFRQGPPSEGFDPSELGEFNESDFGTWNESDIGTWNESDIGTWNESDVGGFDNSTYDPSWDNSTWDPSAEGGYNGTDLPEYNETFAPSFTEGARRMQQFRRLQMRMRRQ